MHACDLGTLDVGELQNLLSGRPVGASQVTAVVRHAARGGTRIRAYRAILRASLEPPFFVRLRSPVSLSAAGRRRRWGSVVGNFWAERLVGPVL
jgi:hypothetical protein